MYIPVLIEIALFLSKHQWEGLIAKKLLINFQLSKEILAISHSDADIIGLTDDKGYVLNVNLQSCPLFMNVTYRTKTCNRVCTNMSNMMGASVEEDLLILLEITPFFGGVHCA